MLEYGTDSLFETNTDDKHKMHIKLLPWMIVREYRPKQNKLKKSVSHHELIHVFEYCRSIGVMHI